MDDLLQGALCRARESQFYRHLPQGSSIQQMPITTKKDLRNGYPFGFLAVDFKRVVSYHESTGSEGTPISSYFTLNDWDDVVSRFLRNAANLKPDDVFFIKTPYSMVTTAHQAQRAAEKVNALVIPADNRSSSMSYSRVIQLLRDLKVTVTWSLPTETLLWRIVVELQERSVDEFGHLRAFWVAGEPLSQGRKRAISDLWNGKAVFEDYGSTETGSLGGDCAKGKLHVWSDRVKFEVFHQGNSSITPFGRGQCLVTPLFREAMPLIRYLIEDEVELLDVECECGSPFPILRIFGRSRDAICVGKRVLYPLVVEDSVFRAGKNAHLVLWRGFPIKRTLYIEYFGLNQKSSDEDIAEMIADDLKIAVKVARKDLDSFLDPKKLMSIQKFSKPRFLFRGREESLRGVQYA